MVMESINVIIDDTITNIANDDSVEGTSSKEAIVEIEAQSVEVEECSLERESTPVNSRMETRSLFRSLSPPTPPEVHPSISRNDEVSTSKKHHLEWLKIIRKVTLSIL